MRRILPISLCSLCGSLICPLTQAQQPPLREEHFGAWKLHDISEHAPPSSFQVELFTDTQTESPKRSFTGGDFSGLFASRYGPSRPEDARLPVAVFDFGTGETRHPLESLDDVNAYVAGQGVQGSRVLMFGTAGPEGERVSASWLYEWEADSLTTIPSDVVSGFDIAQADTLSPSGQVVLGGGVFGDAITNAHRSLVLWDPLTEEEVARIDPPWETEKIPGIPESLSANGTLIAYSVSDSGWVTGHAKVGPSLTNGHYPRGTSRILANFHLALRHRIQGRPGGVLLYRAAPMAHFQGRVPKDSLRCR